MMAGVATSGFFHGFHVLDRLLVVGLLVVAGGGRRALAGGLAHDAGGW